MKNKTLLLIIAALGIAGAALFFLKRKKEPRIIEGFEDINEWVIDSGSLEADTVNFKQGSQGLKFISGGGGIQAKATKGVNLDLSFMDLPENSLAFWVYIYDLSSVVGLYIYFSSTSNFSKHFISRSILAEELNEGWNKIILNKDDFLDQFGESWQNIMVRLRFMIMDTGISTSVTVDDLR